MLKTNNDVLNSEHELQELDEPPSTSFLMSGNTIPILQINKPDNKTIPISDKSLEFLKRFYPLSTVEDWNNWRWQIKNSITGIEALSKVISLTDKEKSYFSHELCSDILPVRITPYYASLLDKDSIEQPIRKSVIPIVDEFELNKGEKADPLSENRDHPINVDNIVHRYPDRVLFLATGFCSTYCRYCTRSHMVAKDKCHVGIKSWHLGIDYIKAHTEIRDVLISGGDPLTMPDSQIDYLLSELRKIEHVQIIRIGTKVPVVLPQRITKNLVNILKKYHPLYLSIHFTHAEEITPEIRYACHKLANAGIPLGSQTVLLKGINDDVSSIKELVHGLLKIRVRPYYLYQCDPVPGSAHFRTPIKKGLDIIFALRGNTSGYAIPHFVVDAPGGGGKIPLLPEYVVAHNKEELLLRNFENKIFSYPEI